MSDFSGVLGANEKVLWSGRPAKKAFILPALGGIPFGSVFLTFFFVWLSGVPFMATLPIELAVMLAVWGFGLIVVPPLWQLMKYPNMEYVFTDRRLIIRRWALGKRVWSVDRSEIKDFGAKFGLVDKFFGTGTVYPITPSYPFAPRRWFPYTRNGDGAGDPWHCLILRLESMKSLLKCRYGRRQLFILPCRRWKSLLRFREFSEMP